MPESNYTLKLTLAEATAVRVACSIQLQALKSEIQRTLANGDKPDVATVELMDIYQRLVTRI